MASGSVETSRSLGMLVEGSSGEKGSLRFLRGRVGSTGPFKFSPVFVQRGFVLVVKTSFGLAGQNRFLFMCLEFVFGISKSSSCIA